ncbi:Protein-tyrosine-phosphatase MKP1 [Quillaja saponaria]|uniref:Protein-tyrosine-phosphatase MKP1 n=1 Tax=Quillaja saponaria TaxID=32244 RepID=A0AAD7PJ86_QUISA|nr:Protein-tyrosine-phosphatase MKP1 [Quillaja saponaria]
MLGEEDKNRLSGGPRRTYSRSVSWTDRSPTQPTSIRRPQGSSKARSCLPPLQPLSISKRNAEEWPRAGSDDLGVWPHPQTPRGSVKANDDYDLKQPVKEFQFKRDKLAFYDKECSRIAEHIYLGSDAVAKNREVLKKNGITHVLNCVGFVSPEYFKSDFVYKTLWLRDSPSEDITSILYDVFDYFEDVREQGGRVLVHCCQGVSRSTSLVIAYLMWREGQSFEDAFQYVKAARGVTNPNMGFACQLLQCQKRVHAVPASPNSVLRMYRMAPHSPYDPLHLVPKLINHPGAQGLDSRGAFIVQVPSAIYVWSGKDCNSVMSNNARAAAFQVIRYERVKGPIVSIKEGEEPSEFWEALSKEQPIADGGDTLSIENQGNLLSGSSKVVPTVHFSTSKRKVDDYDLDFEIFLKAVSGGVVPPFSVSNTGSETCLPARENGWGKLRRKLANGVMKEFVTSCKMNYGTTASNDESGKVIDIYREEEYQQSVVDPLAPSADMCCSPDSFNCFPNNSPLRAKDTPEEVEHSVPTTGPFLSPPPTCGSPDSFSCFLSSSPKFSSKSPTISPSASDYSSSFTFSPSSSNWSDLSYLSSQQPSPSGLESIDRFNVKNISFHENSFLLHKDSPPSPSYAFSANHTSEGETTYLPCKGSYPSIAQRRGSKPPTLMLLPSVDESSHVHKNPVRSWSFSLLPYLDDDVMKDADCKQSENESNAKELILDSDIISSCSETQSEIDDKRIS